MDFSKITLGELLSSTSETIRRHVFGIIKEITKQKLKQEIKQK